MADVKIVKSKYTGADVTSLGELESGDTVVIPCPVKAAGSVATTGSAGVLGIHRRDTDVYAVGWYSSAGNMQMDGSGGNVLTINSVTGEITCGGVNAAAGQTTLKEVKDTVYAITDGAAFEIDPANGSVQTITLGANRTPAATNFEAGQCVLLGVDDGTAYAITWTTVAPTWVKGGGTASAPTLATTGYTWLLLWKVGTTMYGAEVGKP